ncbi:MAG: 3-deoxy-7-phosphoheptulonate synthase class II [Pseudomonadota bacterium]
MELEDSPIEAVREDTNWAPDSWQNHPAAQQPEYPDQDALAQSLKQLKELPPLVTSWEITSLRKHLAECAAGNAFLLQGGDCAESFADCNSSVITNRLKVLLQMSLVMVQGLQMPVVRLGRFAGQYAKPRSSNEETRDGVTLPSYRGDIVNGPEFTAEARVPDPQRLIRGHSCSAMTMNFVRSLVDGGFADLHHPEYWDLAWMDHSDEAAEYNEMLTQIGRSLRFVETLAGRRVGALRRVEFFTSHEALHLHYEQGQTRQVPRRWGWWNLSTHLPWIGMRTAKVDGAHVEFCRGIRNPIGIKIGPGMTAEWLRELIEILNPDDQPGRLMLIHRMGAGKIAEHLPRLIEAGQRASKTLLWTCDPMHGNTESTASGVKTRRFENIRSEIAQAFEIHESCGSRLGGIHLELTGEDVTECTGGARDLSDDDLKRAYRSTVDPRLNYEQSLELAFEVVRKKRELTSPTTG